MTTAQEALAEIARQEMAAVYGHCYRDDTPGVLSRPAQAPATAIRCEPEQLILGADVIPLAKHRRRTA